MSFPDKNHFLRTSDQSEYLRAKSNYIACRNTKGVERYNWWRICPDGEPYQYPEADRDLLETAYRDCKVASFQADTSTDRVNYRMSTETGSSKGRLSASCLVLRVCRSRDATWVKLEAMQERARFREHEELVDYLREESNRVIESICLQFEKIAPVHMGWKTVIHMLIADYTGPGYTHMNGLYSRQRHLDVSDALGHEHITGANTQLYLNTRLLRHMIQSCAFDRELIVYRGIQDKRGLADIPRATAVQQMTSSSKMLELVPKIRAVATTDSLAVSNIINSIGNYNSAPSEPLKRQRGKYIASQPEHLDIILEYLRSAESLEYVLGLRAEAEEALRGTTKGYVYETPERYRARSVGDTLTFNHFVSTSYNWNVALGHKALRRADECCNFKIIIPKGFPCLHLGGGEEEILLPPCVTFVVTDIDSTRTLITLRPVSYQKVTFDKATLERDVKNYAKTRDATYEFPESEAAYYLQLYLREACRETSAVVRD